MIPSHANCGECGHPHGYGRRLARILDRLAEIGVARASRRMLLGALAQGRSASGGTLSRPRVEFSSFSKNWLASEGFHPGSKLNLERPGVARLAQNVNIRLSNPVWIEHAVACVRPRCATHSAVDHEVGNVDSLRSQLARSTLREAAQGKLAMAKPAESAKPFTLAEAPVSRIAPRPRGVMRRAAC